MITKNVKIPPADPAWCPDARALWTTTLGDYVLEPHHTELLRAACTQLTRADAARTAIDADGVVVLDRFGQQKEHPAYPSNVNATSPTFGSSGKWASTSNYPSHVGHDGPELEHNMPTLRRKRTRHNWTDAHRAFLCYGRNFFGAAGWPLLPRDIPPDILDDMRAAWGHFREEILASWKRERPPWAMRVFEQGEDPGASLPDISDVFEGCGDA